MAASPELAKAVYKLIKYGVMIGLIVSFIILIICSAIVNDNYYIFKNPKFFFSEMLVMGILAGAPVGYISYLRGAPIAASSTEFLVLFLKMVLLHVGFQLSGVYSVLFPKSGKPLNIFQTTGSFITELASEKLS